MTTPPPTTATAVQRSGNTWWAARASLAAARTRRFATRWSGGMGALVVIALLVPLAMQDGRRTDRARIERLSADTLRLGQQRRTAERAVARAESTLIAARTAPLPAPPASPRPARPLPAPATAPVSEFARLIAEAGRDGTSEAALAVAAHPAVSAGPRMRSMADSLRALDARHLARPTEELARALVRARLTILSIAETRERELGPAAPVVRAESPPAAPLPVAAPVTPLVDTVALATELAATRDSLARMQRALDSSVVALRAVEAGSESADAGLTRFTPALLFVVVLIAGLLVRFIAALRHELQAPTIADAAEAERLTGMRILTVVRDAPLEGPARFKPSGVDPFRMLYLGLTATGTRARTAVITGAESEIAAAVGVRLAIAAAADHRSTLILDCDPSQIAVSRTFRERAEPGLHDVLAKAFTWREVARPVGSSDGLPITLLPAGTDRDDLATGLERDALMADFARLRASYELTLAVASRSGVAQALELIEASPVLFTVVVGETRIDQLLAELGALREQGRKLQGLVLWSAPLPKLPSRAELAALLANRKGRTPGGSFAAVQQVIGKNNSNTKT